MSPDILVIVIYLLLWRRHAHDLPLEFVRLIWRENSSNVNLSKLWRTADNRTARKMSEYTSNQLSK